MIEVWVKDTISPHFNLLAQREKGLLRYFLGGAIMRELPGIESMNPDNKALQMLL